MEMPTEEDMEMLLDGLDADSTNGEATSQEKRKSERNEL